MDNVNNSPVDKYYLIFWLMILHGIGILTPWNMFITANSYFVDYKLGKSYIGVVTPMATYFLGYVGITSQIPNVAFNWINVFIEMKGENFTPRIVGSLAIELIMFIVTVILAMVESSSWYAAFFWITMVTIVILNIAGGIYQNCIYGMIAKLPIEYTGAIVLGTNISGVFTVVVSMLSTKIFSSVHTAAIYYFITAIIILLLCFDTYFTLPLNKYFRYHEAKAEKEKHLKMRDGIITSIRPPYFDIFKQSFPQLFNVFFIFFVTLAVFPQVQADIKRSDPNFCIPEKYYSDVMCFLTFNVWAMLGSLIASFVQWPAPQYLVWPVVARVIFIPLFILCKYEPVGIDRVMPVVITSDGFYWFLGTIMAVSSGYLSSLGMMYAPKTVGLEYSATAGMFAGAMNISGIFIGILFGMAMPSAIATISW